MDDDRLSFDTVWMNTPWCFNSGNIQYIPVDVAYTATYTLDIEQYELWAFDPVLLPPVYRVLFMAWTVPTCHY
jgi:hypothetical protein